MSRVAFGLSQPTAAQIRRMLRTEPESTPEIGFCRKCDCPGFRYVPPPLSGVACLDVVHTQLDCASNASGISLTERSKTKLRYSLGGSAVDVVATRATIALFEHGEDSPFKIFRTRSKAPSDVVRAVIEKLKPKRSNA